MSWAKVNEETITKTFKKRISNALGGSEGHFLYEESEFKCSDSDEEFLVFHQREDSEDSHSDVIGF
jgi:hypothetical protein